MKHWNVPKLNDGFTLIEVLTVTIILGIVGAIAVPNVLGQLNKSRVTSGLAMLEGALEEARRQAIRNSQNCSIHVTSTTVISFGRTEERGLITVQNNDSDGCLLDDRILPTGVFLAIASDAFPQTPLTDFSIPITFTSKGTTSNAGIAVVYNPQLSEDSDRCLEITGLFGDIQTGFHEWDGEDRKVANTCNIN